ncbi:MULTISPECIES: cytochrome C oxidase subunit IV family protein [unclassified Pseudomonas]|uniref:cytochrome C oxidase subunit IV family protein n=1 Tax=unclassified Pseudomonas TaxID=196821 RepID=UPI000C88372A|nr:MULTISPECIES: cytochrome C oxidase subunit IV family protein [unclassified Pseudomonas]PMX27440.1 hypothetical protein C1Y23_09075 [Pseudomonas sp. GW460-12]PMX34492.1 hypothetical protein C1Y24_13615 [Pseudomonas sp. MPR-R2A4]PMX41900.1 hypothetical protein C1Y26_09000 [Pseudomonas sp. MPR-R2A7]PMX53855.1 hypothetical protein C1Y17_11515 [Pseudomonas sp. MPR-R2A6]PMX91336.1 hypothetical protein C1Y21_11950 [Pseudomonas sp. MPR-R2A3]
MNISMTKNVVYFWLLLISVLGWCLSHDLFATLDLPNVNFYISNVVLIMSLVKVRLVIMYFMEIKSAPWLLKLAFEAWLLIAFFAIVIPFWLSWWAQ